MRFAGHRIEDYFAGPNMGKLVGGAEQINAREKAAGIQAQAQVASSSIYGDATKEAGEVLGAAEAAAGRDAMWGSIFNTVGQVGGAAIGKFGPQLGNPTPSPSPTPPRTMPDAPTQTGPGYHINGRDWGIGYPNVG